MFSQIAQIAHSDDVTSSENVSRIHGTSSEDSQPPLKKPKMEPLEDVKDQNTSDSDVFNSTNLLINIINHQIDVITGSKDSDSDDTFTIRDVVQHLIDVTLLDSESATSPDDDDDDVTIIYDSKIQPPQKKPKMEQFEDVNDQNTSDSDVFNSTNLLINVINHQIDVITGSKDSDSDDTSTIRDVVQHIIDVTVFNSESATSPDDEDDDVTIIYDSRIQPEDVKEQNTSDSDDFTSTIKDVVQHLIDVTVSDSESATSPDDKDDDDEILPIADITSSSVYKRCSRSYVRAPEVNKFRRSSDDVTNQTSEDMDSGFGTQIPPDDVVNNSEVVNAPDEVSIDSEVLTTPEDVVSGNSEVPNASEVNVVNNSEVVNAPEDVSQNSENIEAPEDVSMNSDDVGSGNSEASNAPEVDVSNSEGHHAPEEVVTEISRSQPLVAEKPSRSLSPDPEVVNAPEADVFNNSEVSSNSVNIDFDSEDRNAPEDVSMDSDDVVSGNSEASNAPEVDVSNSEGHHAPEEVITDVSRSQQLVVLTSSRQTSPDSEVVNAPEIDVFNSSEAHRESDDVNSESGNAVVPEDVASKNSEEPKSNSDDRIMPKLKKRQLCRSDSSDDDDTSDSEGQKIQKKKKPSSSPKITINIPRPSAISDALNNISMSPPTNSPPPDVFRMFEDLRLLKHDDDDVMSLTPMAKQRGAVAQYCQYIVRILEARLMDFQIEGLLQSRKARTELYERLVDEGLLSGPKSDGSRIEQIPLYAFLMSLKTREAYIHGLRNGKMYTGYNIHEKIFDASMINDDDVAECISYRTTSSESSSEGSSSQVIVMKSQLMIKCMDFIKSGRSDWRELLSGDKGRMVLDVKKVSTMDDVKDRRFLVCYEEMPPITQILDKRLNCVVINPSDASLRLILDHQPHRHFQGNMSEAAYGGNFGNLNYQCFGPEVTKPNGKIPTTGSLTALFKFATNNTSEYLKGNIYAVEEFF